MGVGREKQKALPVQRVGCPVVSDATIIAQIKVL